MATKLDHLDRAHKHSTRYSDKQYHMALDGARRISGPSPSWFDGWVLYGAGAETLTLATGAIGKICPRAEKRTTAVYTHKTNKHRG